jgi:signal transduction histidine kinase
MIGILGHDLRNPMNAIRSSTQLLLAREEREETRRALLRIDRSSRRMTEMISTLLDFADTRFNAELKMNAATIDLADVVRSVADEVLAANPGRKIRLDAEREAIGFWDSGRLAQVVSNLLDNALKHGASDGEVWATVRLDEPETVVLRVSNAGAPIPAEAIGDLFKPFRAGRAARAASERSVDSSAQRGLGLGLYIVDQIVRAHAGTIDVQSSPESGTVFTVRLPQRGAPTRH